MTTNDGVPWSVFAREAPELASVVRACFAVRKHCTLATLRRDGSPRMSGTEVALGQDELELGSMPRALKALDLLRDPRCAVHSPTVDPPEGDESAWPGEAKVAGRGVVVDGGVPGHPPDSHRSRLALTEVVHTRVGTPADSLVITSWHPGRGVERRRR
jgi:hypothetical protein